MSNTVEVMDAGVKYDPTPQDVTDDAHLLCLTQ
jgi:hypothetical protein